MSDNKPTPAEPAALSEFDLPEGVLTPSQEDQTPAPDVVKKPEEDLKDEEKVKEPAPKEPSKEQENMFTLGNYKRLKRATSFQIEGINHPLYGRVLFTVNPYTPRDANTSGRIPMAFPSMGAAGASSNLEAIQSLDFKKDTSAQLWASVVDQSMNLVPSDDGLFEALAREGSEWIQVPKHGETPLTMGVARTPAHENAVLKDSQALLYAMSALDLGSPTQVPLWNSGFWVSFRPASEDAWVNFNERLTSDKIIFGRNSSGLVFSNVNAIFTQRALEFALDHMLSHNIEMEAGSSRKDILKMIKAPDINAFLWAFLVACHPSGYPINRGCTGSVGSCTAEISDTINLRLLQVTDWNALDEKQRMHMSKRTANSVTEAEVRDYQNSLLAAQSREVTLLDSDKLVFKALFAVPSAEDYINSGHRWIDNIVEMVNNIIAKEATDRQREQVYNKYGRASALREYSHWIKEIHLNSNKVEDLNTLETLLTDVTPRDDLRKKFYQEVRKFINQSIVSVIAIPNYTCPECQKIQIEKDADDRFADAIPLDVTQAFFNLALLRLIEITNR